MGLKGPFGNLPNSYRRVKSETLPHCGDCKHYPLAFICSYWRDLVTPDSVCDAWEAQERGK